MSFVDVWAGLRVAWGGAFVGSGDIWSVVWPDEWPTVHWLAWGLFLVGWMRVLLVGLIGVG